MKLAEAIKQNRFKTEEERTIINILYTAYWLNDIHTTVLSPFDISMQQFNILRILRGQFPKAASVNLLRERMLDKNSGVSRLVEKLRKKGLVIREENTKDRRQVDVRITQNGLDLLAKLDEKMQTVISLANCFSSQDMDNLNRMLDMLRDQKPVFKY